MDGSVGGWDDVWREGEEERGWVGGWVDAWVPYLVGAALVDQADVLEEEEGIFNRTFLWVTLQSLGAGQVGQAV